MSAPTVTFSYAKSKAGNVANKAAFRAGGGDQVAKEREKYARALTRTSDKRVGLAEAFGALAEAERAIPKRRKVQAGRR